LLLAHGADFNLKDNEGYTSLHHAVYGGKDAMKLLLAKGAEVNAKTEKGETPLKIAMARGFKDVVELLRQHGGHE
jgi:ankyrin repeat protein